MKIVPPYPDYEFFRDGPDSCFNVWDAAVATRTLCDLSIMAYSGMGQLSARTGPFKFIRFICCRETQAIVVCDDRFADDGDLCVAFRGTELYNLKDWLIDFDCRMEGGIHAGFLKAWRDVESEVNKLAKNYRRLFLTGHSMGSAVATVAARFVDHPCDLVTFGSPRVGDEEFCGKVRERCGPYCDRIVHGHDMVPTLPPESMGYRHVGVLHKLKSRRRPLVNLLTPRPVFDHVPTLYGEALWSGEVEE